MTHGAGTGPRELGPVGLCLECSHVKVVENRQGSRFYLCLRAHSDPTFRRYPEVPVLKCRGFETVEEQ